MSNVKRFVKEQLDLKETAEEVEQSKVRFSVTVPPEVNRRLEYCAKELEYSKTGFANVLIEKALDDVEDVLGLKLFDGDKLTEYGEYVYGVSAGEGSRNEREVS